MEILSNSVKKLHFATRCGLKRTSTSDYPRPGLHDLNCSAIRDGEADDIEKMVILLFTNSNFIWTEISRAGKSSRKSF